jgi:hypothetical protein
LGRLNRGWILDSDGRHILRWLLTANGVNSPGSRACAFGIEAVACVVLEKSFAHLAAAAIMRANKQYSSPVKHRNYPD